MSHNVINSKMIDGLVVIPGYNKSSIILAKPFIRKTKTYRMSAYSKILNDAWIPTNLHLFGNC
jgi:hypothetical protein